jgi:hypothetical protein
MRLDWYNEEGKLIVLVQPGDKFTRENGKWILIGGKPSGGPSSLK